MLLFPSLYLVSNFTFPIIICSFNEIKVKLLSVIDGHFLNTRQFYYVKN